MAKRIEKIVLNNFKGATSTVEIEIDNKKSTVMIFGENGTGKSTIVDAIDFVFRNKFGSLEDKSVTENKNSHIATLGKSLNDVQVIVFYDKNSFTGKIGFRNKPETDPNNGLPTVRILRRNNILDLVNGQPRDRYEALRDYIKVPLCQKAEQSLRDAKRQTENDYQRAIDLLAEAQSSLKSYCQSEGKVEADYFKWAKEKAKEDKSDLEKEVNELQEFIKILESVKTKKSELHENQQNYSNALKDHEQKKEALLKKSLDENINLVELLSTADQYLSKQKGIENCPLCEQGIQFENLKSNIKKRLGELEEIQSIIENEKRSKEQADLQARLLKQKEKTFLNTISNLANAILDRNIQLVQDIILDWGKFADLLDEEIDINENNIKPALELYELVASTEQRIKALYDEKNSSLSQLNAIKTLVTKITDNEYKAEKFEQIIKKIDQLIPILEQERKAFVLDILGRISNLVEELYSKIHPNEGLGGIQFFLREKYQGSLEYKGTFQGKDVPPQASFSESHLDTLGVCVFLALAKHYNDENTIVILDDVITSVDQVHMSRFFDLLNNEADHFNQLFITTHYRPWRDRYRYTTGPASNIQLIELLHWSLPRGIQSTKTRLHVEEIQEFLGDDKFDRQIIASKSGILLEGLLDHLSLRYRCKLPRQPEPNYTLGDLVNALPKKLKQSLFIEKIISKENTETIQLSSVLEEINNLAWIRNQIGCHFNISGMDISDREVREFAEKTIAFAKTLICDQCGEMPSKDRTGSYWQCKCRKTRLHPLNNPA
jgi:recombinational DNA repair ATPase RecF